MASRVEAGLGAILSPPQAIPDSLHLRRTLRYVALNPCRAHLSSDPLAWPLSTHRDGVGLALPAVVRAPDEDWRWHAYVSSDPSAAVQGTELPFRGDRAISVQELRQAWSAATRVPLGELARKGRARAAFLRVIRALCEGTHTARADQAGVTRQTLIRVEPLELRAARVVRRIAGDTRFYGLEDGSLTSLPEWRRYCRARGIGVAVG